MAHKIYHGNPSKMYNTGTSAGVQWLRLCFHVGGTSSIPIWGAEIPHAMQYSQNKKKKCAVQWYIVHSQRCCSRYHYFVPDHFHHPRRKSYTC